MHTLQQRKLQAKMNSCVNSSSTFKEATTLILHILFQRTEKKKVLPNSFYESSITLT